MKKMNIPLVGTLMVLSLVVCPILYFHMGPALNESQLEVFKLIGIIAGCSALFCFIVGELSGNNSQVDKVWSILPFVYCWIIAVKGGMHPRLVVMAVLATLWGLRLSFNFARKGAYRLKFWEGEEDYRWKILRANPMLKNRVVWMLFDLIFISGYQNAIVLMLTFPALVCMGSTAPFGCIDAVAAVLMLYTLEQKEVLRFKDLWREIPDISQKMLTSTLRKLEDDGIVSREVFTEVPPRVEYRLSERGQSLMPHLDALISWGLEHQNSILKDRTKHSTSNN